MTTDSQSFHSVVKDLRDGSTYEVRSNTAGDYVREEGAFVVVSYENGRKRVRIPVLYAQIIDSSDSRIPPSNIPSTTRERSVDSSTNQESRDREFPMQLDSRKTIDLECRVCGHKGVNLDVLSFFWWDEKRDAFLWCAIKALCPDCKNTADYDVEADYLAEVSGSPAVREGITKRRNMWTELYGS